MSPLTRHLSLPALVPLAFFAAASTPVEVLGCLGRGLLVSAIALGSGLTALGIACGGVKRRVVGDPDTSWWMVTTLVLTIPVVSLLILG